MKQYTLEEIFDFLIGHTGIACETCYDDASYHNLETLNDIAIYIMQKLYDNAKYYGDYRASANAIAKKSINITENLKEWCDDIIRNKEEFEKENNNG